MKNSSRKKLWTVGGAGLNAKNLLILSVLLLFFLAGVAHAKGPKHKGPVVGQFDSYVLSLSWQPAFCEIKPDKKECTTQTPDRYDATNVALHGLWPNQNKDRNHTYGFCGVKNSVRKLDNASTWCKMPSPNLTDKTKKDLALYMPGYASCLERHEWYKHGTCSAMDADTYFSTANRLVTTFAATSMGKYISANVGNTIAADDVLSEFEKDLGAGSSQSVKLHCAKGPHTDMLVEIRVYLAKPIHEGGRLKDMLVSPPAFEKGDCPPRFLVDKVD